VTESHDTLVLIKPDGVERNLIGEILRRIEAKGYDIVDLRMVTPGRELLVDSTTQSTKANPSLNRWLSSCHRAGRCSHVSAATASSRVSALSLAATDPTTAAPGSIRGDLGRDWGAKVQKNLVHGSDSPESAARELALWF
jgi:nucleoside-diphosphate kinase